MALKYKWEVTVPEFKSEYETYQEANTALNNVLAVAQCSDDDVEFSLRKVVDWRDSDTGQL